jgi:hypothetical protein
VCWLKWNLKIGTLVVKLKRRLQEMLDMGHLPR